MKPYAVRDCDTDLSDHETFADALVVAMRTEGRDVHVVNRDRDGGKLSLEEQDAWNRANDARNGRK